MLRAFLIAAVTVLTLVSCSKDQEEDTPAEFFSAKINGVKKEFNFSVAAQLDIDSPQDYNLFINGNGGTSSNPLPNFDVEVHADGPIETKTYQTIQSQFRWEAEANYWLDGSTSYSIEAHDFSITITSITATEVKGTFSGTLEEFTTGEILNITEGMFSAKLVP